ncbi:hypothetical protein [Mesorhizobium sp. BE184]|uniref:hypothetical protein n=1 Tax=Mesorhizobium sp. BE184 TaxID=2817714 RepID=UPI00285E8158|nr:hypothetical protein [Mesorhizobium sp. BE184]MDR7033483.1 putative nucleotidyltransferase [Mesorhizobium sp. BE184]
MLAAGQTIKLLKDTISVDVDFITSQCYLRPNDVVILAGSLVEDMGNLYSDLDVYVITDELRSSDMIDIGRHHRVLTVERDIARKGCTPKQVLLIHTVLPQSKIKVDVEFKTRKEFDSLFDEVRSMHAYACDNLAMMSKRLKPRDEFIIHRLFNCSAIINESALQDLKSQLSLSQYAYLSYRWFASDFSVLLDLLGAWHQGRIDLAADLARELVVLEMTGFLCLLGVTNIRRKWLLVYVEQTEMDATIKQRFLESFFFQGADSPQQKVAHVEKSLDLIDDIYDASRPLLERLPNPSGEQALAKLRQEVHLDPAGGEEYVEMEYNFRAKPYGQKGTPTRLLLPPLGAGTLT